MRRFPCFLFTLLLAACDCGGGGDPTRCDTTADCNAGRVCIDGMCMRPEGRDVGPADDAPAMMCEDDRDPCGSGSLARCCPSDEACMDGRCVVDCGERELCGGVCCADTDECLDGECRVFCEDEAQRCGVDGELCCGGEQACLSDDCVDLGEPCTLTEECEFGELCEPTLGRCIPRDAVDVCEFRPPVGEFNPQVGCRWVPEVNVNYDDVVMTPSVANLTDDNGDGRTDTMDIPDIAFVSFRRAEDGCCTANGRLRVVSGLCNDDGTMNTLATITMPFVDNSSGVALGNLHPDAMADEHPPEIVVTFKAAGTIAFRRTADDGSAWEEMWRNRSDVPADPGGGAQPAIADVDGDGSPEVVVGNIVLNGQTGALRWNGRATVGAGAGVGNNAFLGPVSTVADIDLDGQMEVIAGNTVYNGADGAEEWTFDFPSASSGCGGAVACDGYVAIGNFDADDQAEVVIVRRGDVWILEHDGTLKQRIPIPTIGSGLNESGPPTIADFDGDGRPEIGTAGARFYVVLDLDCEGDPLPSECASQHVLWQVPNDDDSSRATGSSVFDFEGDGAAEVVYADETSFRIFDGRTGAILYDDPTHRSNTRMEMPIVVDVDNDGKSEVVVPEPNNGAGVGGIEIWEDADNNWVRTRRIWNQHTYHVTNVTEDGQIPRSEPPNWLEPRLNNFRQNVQPGGLFDAPDLVVVSIELDRCDAGGTVDVAVTVGNRGALGVAAGLPVTATLTPGDGTPAIDLGVQRTTRFLLPGQEETLIFSPTFAGGFTFRDFTVSATVDSDGMGGSEYNECIEDNNDRTSEVLMTCDFG